MSKAACAASKPIPDNNVDASAWSRAPFAAHHANRGVEAKESRAGQCHDAGDEALTASPSAADRSSASCVQVVVQKQRRGCRRSPPVQRTGDAAERLAAAATHCPALRALLQLPAPAPGALAAAPLVPPVGAPARTKHQARGVWQKLGDVVAGRVAPSGAGGPERVALFRLERGAALTATRSWDPAGRGTRVERLARLLAAPAAALLDELLALLRLAFALPVHVALRAARCALSSGAWAAGGALQAVADEALTPALALGFNALLRPPLVVGGHAALVLRDAARPLWLALGDALEPLARLAGAVRLVHVEARPRVQRV